MKPGDVEGAVLLSLQKGEDSPLIHRIKKENRLLLHNYQKEVPKTLYCELDGCSNDFSIVLIPNQIIYPKYCPEHRSPHRREHFQDSKS